jgi:hypothetical protein
VTTPIVAVLAAPERKITAHALEVVENRKHDNAKQFSSLVALGALCAGDATLYARYGEHLSEAIGVKGDSVRSQLEKVDRDEVAHKGRVP